MLDSNMRFLQYGIILDPTLQQLSYPGVYANISKLRAVAVLFLNVVMAIPAFIYVVLLF